MKRPYRSRAGTLVLLWWVATLVPPAGAALGDMVVQCWAVAGGVPHPGTVKIAEASAAAGVVQVDLSALPKAARVYRARLWVDREPADPTGREALVRNEVFPLKAPFEPGKPPQAAAKPLAIAPPRFDCFDATEAVRAAAGGQCELLVKSLPGWVAESTRLEIAYEGTAKQVPTQVAGLKVVHRAGQTFIAWKEVAPLITAGKATWGEIKAKLAEAKDAFSYRVYVHGRPINAKTIAEADLIARVDTLSCWNVSGRSMEYLIGQAMIQPDEIGELARNYNGYMYSWGMDHPRMDRYPVQRFVIDPKAGPLPAGTGLYVHSPAAAGKRYYAVVSVCKGVENTVDFSAGNALAEPVAETVGLGEPVCQGEGLWGPYFDYPGRRQLYVQWAGGSPARKAASAGPAAPLAPRQNMSFNWSVLVPPGLKQGRKAPVEMYLHTGNFSYAKPRKKYVSSSIQIAPHDWPFSGWYGYNDALGTLKSWPDGVVRNHTQRRIIAFLEWAKRTFPVDEDRIILSGSDGAAALALNYREVFACVLVPGFGGGREVQGRVLNPNEAKRFASAWGPKHPDVKDEAGRGDWGWAMLDKLALARAAAPVPLTVCRGTSWGGKRFYGSGFGPFYDAMMSAGQPVIGGHGWDTQLIRPGWHTGLWRGLDVTRKTPVMAFANSASSHMKLQSGNTNWYHQWKDVTDEPDRFSVTLFGGGKADVTPRRLQKFKVKPGETLRWETKPLPDPRRRQETPPPRSGAVAASVHGVVTLKGVAIGPGGVTVTLRRAK